MRSSVRFRITSGLLVTRPELLSETVGESRGDCRDSAKFSSRLGAWIAQALQHFLGATSARPRDYVSGCAERACCEASSCPAVSPHFTICFTTGIRLLPSVVSLYSTLGGTTGYCLRWIKPRVCNSFNSRLRTRGVTGAPRAATIADLRSSPYRREPSFSSQRILILYLPPAAWLNAINGQNFSPNCFGFVISKSPSAAIHKSDYTIDYAYSILFVHTCNIVLYGLW